MPSNILYIDNHFPTFTGEENSKEQIDIMLNYLRILVEQLRYTLKNLDTSNFNSKAMEDWSEASTEDIRQGLTTMGAELEQLTRDTSALSGIIGRVGNLEDRMNAAEGSIDSLREDVDMLKAEMAQLKLSISVDEDGNAVFGKDTQSTDIRGNVYINGIPYV